MDTEQVMRPTPGLKDILYLLSIPNIGPGRVRKLLSVFESVDEITRVPVRQLMRLDGIDSKLAAQIKAGGSFQDVARQVEQIEAQGISFLTIWHPSYPLALKKTADPPVLLFYKGDIPQSWPPTIAVVGTRTPTTYGKMVTEKLVNELVDNNIAIVSGLARGIDTIAHRATLKRNGTTFAVLGCGLDCVYPPENKQIFEEIPRHGAIFSEYLPGTGPDAQNFPRRNRIISGLSLGVLIVEAGEKSGALITAEYALDQNREVFAVPGQITNPKTRGTHRLIQQGAKLVQSASDILEEIMGSYIQKPAATRPIPTHLNNLERDILEHLSADPKHIDKLVLEIRESPALILSSLLNLELQGMVRQLSGKMFIRV